MDTPQKAIYNTIKIMIDEALKKLGYNYTKKGVVESVDGNKAVVLIDDAESICDIRSGLPLYPNDVVIVMIQQNDYSAKYVDGKLMKVNEDIPPANNDIADAVSKKHFPEEVGGHKYSIQGIAPLTPKNLDVWIDTISHTLKVNLGTPANPNWVIFNGDVDFMPKLSGSNLPLARIEYRGLIFNKEGSAGNADESYICMKKVDNNYEWRKINFE